MKKCDGYIKVSQELEPSRLL